MDNKLYDTLAWTNRVFMPAFGAFVAGILAILKIDGVIIGAVCGILEITNTFLGTLLQDKKKRYEEGKE